MWDWRIRVGQPVNVGELEGQTAGLPHDNVVFAVLDPTPFCAYADHVQHAKDDDIAAIFV